MTGTPTEDPGLRLRIVATSDVHGHLWPHDYFADAPAPGTGLLAAAPMIRRLLDEAPGALLVDCGDFLQGTALADAGATASPDPHPVITAMAGLGYHAAALGNHEFNYGLPVLEAALARAPFPILCGNLTRPDGRPFVAPWTVIRRELPAAGGPVTLRVGLLGVLPPQTVAWDRSHIGNALVAEDIVSAARRAVAEIREAGAEILIALCHSGIGAEAETPGMENAAVPLAALDGIDALVTGHIHKVFPGPAIPASPAVDPERGRLHGKPAVMPGFNASHLGVLDLDLIRDGSGWQVSGRARALPIVGEDLEETPLTRALAPAHVAARALISRPIGRLTGPLTSYFALAGPCAALTLVADAQRHHVRAAAPDLPDLPLLSAAASFRSGGWGGPDNYIDVPAGPLAYRTATELYPYPNQLVVIELTGGDIADWLERAASIFRQAMPGDGGTPLLHPGVPGYTFDIIDGVTWQVDVTAPARYGPTGALRDPGASRIRDLRLCGQPLDPATRVLVATNSYRHGGGGEIGAPARGILRYRSRLATRDAVATYIEALGTVTPEARVAWRFAPAAKPTRVVFETGPGALDHPLPAIGRGLAPLGIGPSGHAQIEIAL